MRKSTLAEFSAFDMRREFALRNNNFMGFILFMTSIGNEVFNTGGKQWESR